MAEDKRQRIGIDGTPLLYPLSGVGYYTLRLVDGLVRNGPEWDYLLLSNRPLPRAPAGSGMLERGRFPIRLAWMQCILPPVLAGLQPALSHFTNSVAPLVKVSPTVITIHDMSLFLYANHHRRKSLLAMRSVIPYVARRADQVITVSYTARRDVMRVLGLPADRVRVVYNAAGPEFHPVTDVDWLEVVRRIYRLDQPFILYVGTIEPRKNLVRAVEALARWRLAGLPHRLMIVGSWGWSYGALLERIEQLGLQNAVQFTGYVPEDHLPALYTLADVFLFPSIYEGFGLPVVEAMACGTPVLTSAGSAMAEITGSAALLVDPYSAEALAEAVCQVVADPALRAELSARGLARAAEFSWDRAARETLRVYAGVLDRPYTCSTVAAV